eukprot:EC799691.1.p1 GENE.EC799691.1~~EC799691.1.p1  ORF type:complete len:196 (+),score=60.69 EC799691.1:112-699(+)
MGRKAIEIAYIPDRKRRRTTFRKRREGCIKKLSELSSLTGCQLFLAVMDEEGGMQRFVFGAEDPTKLIRLVNVTSPADVRVFRRDVVDDSSSGASGDEDASSLLMRLAAAASATAAEDDRHSVCSSSSVTTDEGDHVEMAPLRAITAAQYQRIGKGDHAAVAVGEAFVVSSGGVTAAPEASMAAAADYPLPEDEM